MRKSHLRIAAASIAAIPAFAAPVHAQTVTAGASVDLSAGASSSPFLLPRADAASGYAEISVSPNVTLIDGTTTVSFDGNYRHAQYFRLYDSSDSFNGSIRADGRLNERLTVRASGAYSNSIIGELARGAFPGGGTVTDPTIEPPPIDPTDVSLIGTRTRSKTWRVSSGLDWSSSTRDFVSLDASANGQTYSGNSLNNSRGLSAAVNYARALSERIKIGVEFQGQWQNYTGAGNDGSVYQPRVTLTAQLAQQWSLTGGAGLLFVNSRVRGVSDKSVGFSGDVSLCHPGERGNLCLQAYRDAQPTGLGAISKRLGFSLNYYYQLNEKDYLQLSGGYTNLDQSSLVTRQGTDSYGNIQGSLEHRFSRTLSIGTNAAVSKSFGNSFSNRDDVTVFFFIRSRFGKFK